MLTRIQNDLNEYLKPFGLEMSSYIFEDAIPLLAQLEIDELAKSPFRFMKKLDGAGCRFSVNTLDEINKSKLIHFCGMTEISDAPRQDFRSEAEIIDAYEDNDGLDSDYFDIFQVSEEYLETTIIPLFHNFIRTLHFTDPDFLIQHQTRSKYAFEKQALREIEKYSLLLLTDLNAKAELSEQEISFQTLISKVIAERKLLNRKYYTFSPTEFHLLQKILDNFNQFHIEIENAASNSHLSQYIKNIKSLSDNLQIFLRVSPIEAHLNWLMLCNTLNACLLDVKISIHECDIFEHILLALAEIPTPKSSCRFDMDSDDISRMSLTIDDLSSPNAEKLLAFFHQNGAASAKIKKSCFERGKCGPMMIDRTGGCYFHQATPMVQYTINISEVLKNIVKLFLNMIIDIKIKDPSIFLPYQEKSERRFRVEKIVDVKPQEIASEQSTERLLVDSPFGLFNQEKKITENETIVAQPENHEIVQEHVRFNN